MLKVAIPRKYNLRDLTVSQPSERERERERERGKKAGRWGFSTCARERAHQGAKRDVQRPADNQTGGRGPDVAHHPVSSRLLTVSSRYYHHRLLSPDDIAPTLFSYLSLPLSLSLSLSLPLSLSPSIVLLLASSPLSPSLPLCLSPSTSLSLSRIELYFIAFRLPLISKWRTLFRLEHRIVLYTCKLLERGLKSEYNYLPPSDAQC